MSNSENKQGKKLPPGWIKGIPDPDHPGVTNVQAPDGTLYSTNVPTCIKFFLQSFVVLI